MDLGWIITFASPAQMAPQLSVATEGGSGTPVPDISIEVDDLDEVEGRVRAEGLVIEYGPTTEPWGVRRFYVRDPLGRLVNILTHGWKTSLPGRYCCKSRKLHQSQFLVKS